MDRVTEQLWISDIEDVHTKPKTPFDTIITICQDDVADHVGCTYYHYPLSDGPPPEDAYNPGEFDYDLFYDAVKTIINHVSSGDTVLVHCHAGQSRSAMAIVAALTELCDVPFPDAYNMVDNARRGGIHPSQELREFAETFSEYAPYGNRGNNHE